MRTTAIAAGGRPEERAKMVSRSVVITIVIEHSWDEPRPGVL
jgi:hypothetical protein